MPKKKSRIIQVPMPADLVDKLDAISYEVEESRAHVIRDAVAQYITAREHADAVRRDIESYEKYPEDIEELEALSIASAEALEPDDFSHWPDYPKDD